MAKRLREPGHLTIAAYARRRRCDPHDVRRALDDGRIRREADGYIDPERADRDWLNNTSPAYSRRGVGQTDSGLADARTQSEILRVELAEERLVERRKELIDRTWAIEATSKLWNRTRAAWHAWPAKVAPRMAAELGVDADRLRRVLERVVAAQIRAMQPEDITDLLSPRRRGAGQ